jgi:hypothetical protein
LPSASTTRARETGHGETGRADMHLVVEAVVIVDEHSEFRLAVPLEATRSLPLTAAAASGPAAIRSR